MLHNGPPGPLDREYLLILDRGLWHARDAAYEATTDRVRQEFEHLHNLPSLLGEANLHRHYDYYKRTRGRYLDWYQANRPDLLPQVHALFDDAWKALGTKLLELTKRNADGPT